MRAAALLCLALSACGPTYGPRLGAGIVITPGGVSVRPSVSGSIGAVGLSASAAIE